MIAQCSKLLLGSTVILRCVMLVSIAAVFVLNQHSPTGYLPLLLWCGIAICSVAVSLPVALKIFGIAICLSPLFGTDSLSAWLCIWLGAAQVRALYCPQEQAALSPAQRKGFFGLCFVGLALYGPAIPSMLTAVDSKLLSTYISSGGGIWHVLSLLQEPFIEVRRVLTYLLRYWLAIILFWQLARWDRVSPVATSLLCGMVIGALLAATCFFLQFFEAHPFFSSTRSAFWVFSGRYSGSFSDPNAFGLMAGILIPLLWSYATQRKETLSYISCLVLGVAVLWSGSRSFWLILGFWVVAVSFPVVWRRSKWISVAVVSFVLLLVVLIGEPSVNAWLQEYLTTPASSRLLATLLWDNYSVVLQTRLVFWNMALTLWRLAPLGGLGLGSFYHSQEYAAQLIGVDLGEWRDNANNFYLQILAEGGAFALALLLLGFTLIARALFKVRAKSQRDAEVPVQLSGTPTVTGLPTTEGSFRIQSVCRTILLAMLLLLIVGPHLDFDEVRYVLIVCLSIALSSDFATRHSAARNLKLNFFLLTVVSTIFYSAYFFQGSPLPRGWYQSEGAGDAEYRWSGESATLSFCESVPEGTQRELEFSAPRPDLGVDSPLHVSISRKEGGGSRELHRLSITDNKPYHFKFSPLSELPETIEIQVDRVWQPVAVGENGDSRILGVQLKWQEGICERIAATR